MRPIRLHRSHSFFRWSPANHSSRVFKTFRWIWNSITFDCRTYGACTERYRAREPMIVARRVGNTIVTVAVHIYATIRRSRHRRQMNGVTLPSCNSSHQYFIFVRCCNNQQGAPTGVAALCQCSRSTGFEVVAPIDTVLRPFTSYTSLRILQSMPLRVPYFITVVVRDDSFERRWISNFSLDPLGNTRRTHGGS